MLIPELVGFCYRGSGEALGLCMCGGGGGSPVIFAQAIKTLARHPDCFHARPFCSPQLFAHVSLNDSFAAAINMLTIETSIIV